MLLTSQSIKVKEKNSTYEESIETSYPHAFAACDKAVLARTYPSHLLLSYHRFLESYVSVRQV